MSNRTRLLNELLDIGGVATLNNLYSPAAKSRTGNLLQARKYFKFYLEQGLVYKIPTIGKARNPSHETFYCLTKKGAAFIGRPDEYKYKRYPRSPNNVMHESMKFDIALAFVRLYPQLRFSFAYDKSYYHVRPDITIRVDNSPHIKYILVEIERKKSVERVYKEKIKPYEEMFRNMAEKHSHNPAQFLVFFVYTDIYYNVFVRPQGYSEPSTASHIERVNNMVKFLVRKYCRSLPAHRYLFTGFHDFYRLQDSVWFTSQSNRVALVL